MFKFKDDMKAFKVLSDKLLIKISKNISLIWSTLLYLFFFLQILKKREYFAQYGKIVRVVVVPPSEAFLNFRVM